VRIKKNMLLVLGFLAILFFVWYFNLLSIAQSVYGGLTAISIQKEEVISDNPFFNESVYHLVAVVAPNSQEIRGETDSQAMPLKLTITGTSNTRCMYKISNESKKIYYWDNPTSIGRPCRNCGDNPYPAGCRCDDDLYGGTLGCSWSRISTQSITMPKPHSSGCSYYTIQPSNSLAGEFYYIEPVPFYDYNITINFNIGGLDVPIHLTSDNTAGYISDLAYAQLLGSMQGQQGCPSLFTDAVVWRQPNSANMTLVWKYTAQDALSTQTTPSPRKDFGSYTQDANTLINTAKNNKYNPYGFQCKLYSISPTETKIMCDAIGEVAYPVVDLYVKASVLQQFIPQGKPKIINASCPKTEAVSKAICQVKVKNEGQTDTFEVGLQGFKDPTPFSVRQEIKSGEEKTIEVPYSGAGIIGQFKVFVYSVNNPELKDETTVKLVIEPFCDTPKPGCANPQKAMTEKGCFWYCPDYYTTEIGEYSGKNIQTLLDKIGRLNCYDDYGDVKNCSAGDMIDILWEAGEKYHCTNIKTRDTISEYFYDRADGKISAYIPKDRRDEHLYFIPAYYQTYYCSYLAEYGYKYDPQTDSAVSIEENQEFNYEDSLQPEGEGGLSPPIVGGGSGGGNSDLDNLINNVLVGARDTLTDIVSGTTTIPLIGDVSNSTLLTIMGGFLVVGLIAGAPTIKKAMRSVRL